MRHVAEAVACRQYIVDQSRAGVIAAHKEDPFVLAQDGW
jgi:hypothetical protein